MQNRANAQQVNVITQRMNALSLHNASRLLESAFPQYTAALHHAGLNNGLTSPVTLWFYYEQTLGWTPVFGFFEAFTNIISSEVNKELRMFHLNAVDDSRPDRLSLKGQPDPIDRDTVLYQWSGRVARVINTQGVLEDVVLCDKSKCLECWGMSMGWAVPNNLGRRPFVHIMDLAPHPVNTNFEQTYNGHVRPVFEDLPTRIVDKLREVKFKDGKWRWINVCDPVYGPQCKPYIEAATIDEDGALEKLRDTEG